MIKMATSLPLKILVSLSRTANSLSRLKGCTQSKVVFSSSSHICRRFLSQDETNNATSSPIPTVDPGERDPFPLFSDPEVQSLLTNMTGLDLVKLAGPQLKPLHKPSYLLLTDQELSQKETEAKERLQYRLQMPPFMLPRKPFTEPLLVDSDLSGHDTSKYVFADISFGIKDRKRTVVVREPDGSLHVAPWDVKDRMNQIYNPRDGRQAIKPAMFDQENLERMLKEGRYQYILDRACCQFEPDDPDYIRTTRRVYSAVDTAKAYEMLRSTRHFGPLAFYLAWHRMIDSLLLDMINRDLEEHSRDLVRVYCLVHPGSACSEAVAGLTHAEPVDVVKAYIQSEAKLKDQLELAVQALQDNRRSKGNSLDQMGT